MAEDKKNFLQGKMNQDIDDRLLPNGEYREAQNIQITTSEGSDVGTIQNINGNDIVNSDIDLSGYPNAKTIGSLFDEKSKKIFYFVTDYTCEDIDNTGLIGEESGPTPASTDNLCAVYMHDVTIGNTSKLLSGSFLNFSTTHKITGINLVENLLFFTDGLNQPRRINIDKAKNNAEYYDKEEKVSVAKFAPFKAPLLLDYAKVTTNIDSNQNVETSIDTTLQNDSNIDSDILEEDFVRFSYRYRFSENEFSPIAPFTQVCFVPKTANYDVKEQHRVLEDGMVSEMVNNINKVTLYIELPSTQVTSEYDINGIEILMKSSDSNVVKAIELKDLSDDKSADGYISYEYRSTLPYKTLPASQTVRTYDNVPLAAKAQEIISNRVVYGNFVQDRKLPANTDGLVGLNFFASYDSKYNTGLDSKLDYLLHKEYPFHSIKQRRNYEVGVVLADKYGRQSPVLTSLDNGGFVNVIAKPSDFFSDSWDSESSRTTTSPGGENFCGDALDITFNNEISNAYAKKRVGGDTLKDGSIATVTNTGGDVGYYVNIEGGEITIDDDFLYLKGRDSDFVRIIKSKSTGSEIYCEGPISLDYETEYKSTQTSVGHGIDVVYEHEGQYNTRFTPLPNNLLAWKTATNVDTGDVANVLQVPSISTGPYVLDKDFSEGTITLATAASTTKANYTFPQYNLVPHGWYSYRVVVKQIEQEYHNIYTPGIFNYTDINHNKKSYFSLTGDNLNKVTRSEAFKDSDKVGLSASDTQLYPKVVAEDATATQALSNSSIIDVTSMGNATEQGLTNADGFGFDFLHQSEKNPLIIEIPYGNATTELGYEVSTGTFTSGYVTSVSGNKLTATGSTSPLSGGTTLVAGEFLKGANRDLVRITNAAASGSDFVWTCNGTIHASYANVAGIPHNKYDWKYGKQSSLNVLETKPFKSALDIYYETSTSGLVHKLNELIASGGETYKTTDDDGNVVSLASSLPAWDTLTIELRDFNNFSEDTLFKEGDTVRKEYFGRIAIENKEGTDYSSLVDISFSSINRNRSKGNDIKEDFGIEKHNGKWKLFSKNNLTKSEMLEDIFTFNTIIKETNLKQKSRDFAFSLELDNVAPVITSANDIKDLDNNDTVAIEVEEFSSYAKHTEPAPVIILKGHKGDANKTIDGLLFCGTKYDGTNPAERENIYDEDDNLVEELKIKGDGRIVANKTVSSIYSKTFTIKLYDAFKKVAGSQTLVLEPENSTQIKIQLSLLPALQVILPSQFIDLRYYGRPQESYFNKEEGDIVNKGQYRLGTNDPTLTAEFFKERYQDWDITNKKVDHFNYGGLTSQLSPKYDAEVSATGTLKLKIGAIERQLRDLETNENLINPVLSGSSEVNGVTTGTGRRARTTQVAKTIKILGSSGYEQPLPDTIFGSAGSSGDFTYTMKEGVTHVPRPDHFSGTKKFIASYDLKAGNSNRRSWVFNLDTQTIEINWLAQFAANQHGAGYVAWNVGDKDKAAAANGAWYNNFGGGHKDAGDNIKQYFLDGNHIGGSDAFKTVCWADSNSSGYLSHQIWWMRASGIEGHGLGDGVHTKHGSDCSKSDAFDTSAKSFGRGNYGTSEKFQTRLGGIKCFGGDGNVKHIIAPAQWRGDKGGRDDEGNNSVAYTTRTYESDIELNVPGGKYKLYYDLQSYDAKGAKDGWAMSCELKKVFLVRQNPTDNT